MADKTFETEDGLILKLKPVREALLELVRMGVEKEFRDKKEPIDLPTYTVKLVTGETQTYPHLYDLTNPDKPKDTLTVADDPIETARNFGIWEQYTKAKARLEEAQGEAVFMAQLQYGVECEIPEGEMELLAKTMKKYGRELPTAPDEAKALWLVSFGLSRMDKNMLQMELQIVAMGKVVKPEQVAAFRTELRGRVERLAGDALGEALDRLGELDGAPALPPSPGGKGVGENA
jgi:hypothetical protein